MFQKMIFWTTAFLFLFFGTAQAQIPTAKLDRKTAKQIPLTPHVSIAEDNKAQWLWLFTAIERIAALEGKQANVNVDSLIAVLREEMQNGGSNDTLTIVEQIKFDTAIVKFIAKIVLDSLAARTPAAMPAPTAALEEWKEPRISGGVGLGMSSYESWNYLDPRKTAVCADVNATVLMGNPNGSHGRRYALLALASANGGFTTQPVEKTNPLMPTQRKLEGKYIWGEGSILFNYAILQRKSEEGILFSVFAGGGASAAAYQPKKVWLVGYQAQAIGGMIVHAKPADFLFTITLPIGGNVVDGKQRGEPFGGWSTQLTATFHRIGIYARLQSADYRKLYDYTDSRGNGGNKGFNAFGGGLFFNF